MDEEEKAEADTPDARFTTTEIQTEPDRGPFSLEVGSTSQCRVVSLVPGTALVLGAGSEADVRVDDPSVSSRHARVEATDNGVHVEDLGSRNGVYFSGARTRAAWLVATPASFVMGRTTVTVRGAADGVRPAAYGDPIPGLIGGSVPMRRLAAEIRRCARLRAPVLLQGESGTGKDVVARAIHHLSRGDEPYVPINVGAIPDALADAELFGHKRGAFTGAVATRPGAFEEAHKGTLFLDEVAELTPGIQVKLLRVVEDGLVRAVGGMQAVAVDVRIVSATWASLEDRVATGLFREDLYHRISTFIIRLPPLRTRKSDIPALSASMLRRLRGELGPKSLTPTATARLIEHSWPGNVRELGSVLYRAAAGTSGEDIHSDDVEAALLSPSKHKPRALSEGEARALLDEHRGNVSAAARAAGVPRSTFRSWMDRD